MQVHRQLSEAVNRWRTETWFKPTVFTLVGSLPIGILIAVFSTHYGLLFSGGSANSNAVIDLQRPPSEMVSDVEPTDLGGSSDQVSSALALLEESSLEWRKMADEQLEQVKIDNARSLASICTFSNLQLNTPMSNSTIFFSKFFGLNGEPALGKALFESVSKYPISWALKVEEILPIADDQVLIVVSPAEDLCKDIECDDSVYERTAIVEDEDSEILLEIKAGDFIFANGNLHLWSDEGVRSMPFFERIHIHTTSYRYSRGGLSEECKEAISIAARGDTSLKVESPLIEP